MAAVGQPRPARFPRPLGSLSDNGRWPAREAGPRDETAAPNRAADSSIRGGAKRSAWLAMQRIIAPPRQTERKQAPRRPHLPNGPARVQPGRPRVLGCQTKQARRRCRRNAPTAEQPAPRRVLRKVRSGKCQAEARVGRRQSRLPRATRIRREGGCSFSTIRRPLIGACRSAFRTRHLTPQRGRPWRVQCRLGLEVPCRLGNAVPLPESTATPLFYSTASALG